MKDPQYVEARRGGVAETPHKFCNSVVAGNDYDVDAAEYFPKRKNHPVFVSPGQRLRESQ